MDKAEYRIKLDQINELADSGDYKGAVEIVDSIEWRRVKSVRTLCMVGEIYEVNGRLEDSRKILEIAYKRASISKTVLYRLAEVCIKLGDFDAALDYYTEFAEVSPMDNSKYILKYMLYRARKSPLEDQIAILEEYKEREYTERWAYELAKLYSQAGMKDKCVETCDDLILWFSEGKYVAKAMELKMQYTPLTPSQNEKYQKHLKQILTPQPVVPEAKAEEQPQAEEESLDDPDEEVDDEELAKRAALRTEEAIEKMDAAAGATVQEESDLKIPPMKTPIAATTAAKDADPVKMQSQLADSIRAVFSGLAHKTVEVPKATAPVIPDVEPEVEEVPAASVKALEPEAVADNGSVNIAASTAAAQPVPAPSEEQIEGQMTLADLTGESKKVEDVDLDALIAETANTFAQEVKTGEFVRTDDDLESKRNAANEQSNVQETSPETTSEVNTEVNTNTDTKAAEAVNIAGAATLAAGVGAGAEALQQAEAAKKAAEEEAAKKVAEEEAAKKAAAEEAAKKAAEEEALRYAKETDESLGLTREFNFNEELKKAMANGTVESEAAAQVVSKIEELEASAKPQMATEPTADAIKLFEEEKVAEETTAGAVEEAIQPEAKPEVSIAEPQVEVPEAVDATESQPTQTETPVTAEPEVDVTKQMAESMADLSSDDAVKEPATQELPVEEIRKASAAAASEPKDEISKVEEELATIVKDEPKRLKYVPVEPRELDDKEKQFFSYFATIPGISQQITQTICDVHNHAGDKTSKGGNILLIGRQGSGKTRLCDGMILAICKDLEIEAAKVAKVIGRDLNEKDPAAVIAKLSGGFLVIEGAGELSADTVSKLSQAMEFRTDSLVVMLEDEKVDLLAMLKQYPEFAEKFTSAITIPVFTNDELVTFAKTYANEQGYRMDEMGVLALYTMIGDNQKDAEPVTIARVKEMVDTAIERANKGTRKFGRKLSKKAVDEDNRIILYEKDFDFE